MATSFYVYQLRSEAEECPFYIGKGQGKRKYQHFQGARRGNKSLKDSKIRKYEKAGMKVLIEVLFRSQNEEECFRLEVELIKLYGRRDKGLGCLTNQTDGGEGRSGSIISEEQRRKLSEVLSGRIRTIEHCRNLSQVRKGYRVSEGTKAKISKSLTGRKLSTDHIEKLRKASSGRTFLEETKAKISNAHKGKVVTEEQKVRISQTLKGRKRDETSVDKGSKYSRQTAIAHIKAHISSGLSQKQYCLQHSIKEQTFCGWKRSPYVKEALENI